MIVATLILIAVALLGIASSIVAYRNGVADGYGYAREPMNPGYEKAGSYLKRTMRERWPELAEEETG